MSAAENIAEFGRTYTVTRFADTGEYVNGIFVPGPTTTFDAIIAIFPVVGTEILQDKTGQRTRNLKEAFTATELFTGREGAIGKADRVDYNGTFYEVQEVEEWIDAIDLVTTYYRAFIMRLDP